MSKAALSCLEDNSSRHASPLALANLSNPFPQFSLGLGHWSCDVDGARYLILSAL